MCFKYEHSCKECVHYEPKKFVDRDGHIHEGYCTVSRKFITYSMCRHDIEHCYDFDIGYINCNGEVPINVSFAHETYKGGCAPYEVYYCYFDIEHKCKMKKCPKHCPKWFPIYWD